ncbi:MAG: stage V sporulation protein AC [Oscillospiraceae bacterium]|nr:stage V sporulation protein AC [Oscillospiraceae bacterium]
MDISKKQYENINKKHSPKSHIIKDCTWAFCVGGLICCIGQALAKIYIYYGLDKETSFSLASITLILLSAILTGLNIYNSIANVAGAGTLVPITGFANSMVSPALEFQTEGLVLGVGAQMFTIAGPVIVYGVITSVIVGLLTYIFNNFI